MWSAVVLASVLADLTLATPSADWNSLNQTLKGRLQVGVPFARPCFTDVGSSVRGTFAQDECAQIQTSYADHNFRIEKFGSFMNTEWETCQATGEQCLLDYTNTSNVAAFSPPATCSQGSVPSYYVAVQDASDVQAVFAFVKKTKVDLVVKNTGHDYIGRSSGPNALALWTHGLQNISLDRSWTPEGCESAIPTTAITLGAGVTHGMVNPFAVANNITVPGGADLTVGAAGGYLQGGGHSAVSNVYGLAVDRALEFEVVTPEGKHLIANRCQNSDLFFALRGGGGGTFGVVLKATEKAFPQATMQSVHVAFSDIPSNVEAVLKFSIDNGVAWAKQGWGGFILPHQDDSIILTNPLVTADQAAAQMAGLKNLTQTLVNGTFDLSTQNSYPDFFNASLHQRVPVGRPYIMSSRLVPAANFATNKSREELFEKLLTVVQESDLPILSAVTPYYYNGDGETSLHPGWYDSIWHVFSSKFWNYDESLAGRQAIYAKHTAAIQGLRDITPTSGVYANEADVHEPNYTAAFWGSNYKRLLQIKNKYDPDHLLDCWHCVGWKGAQSPRFKCYV